MPQVRYNKLWGLKRLRTVCKHLPGVARFALFKIYDSPTQFRLSHLKENPRLVVRTDEKGRTYRRLMWETVPRFDINVADYQPRWWEVTKGLKTSGIERRIRKGIKAETSRFNQELAKSERADKQFMRYLVHPTRARSDVKYTGNLAVVEGKNSAGSFANQQTVRLSIGERSDFHYFGRGNSIVLFHISKSPSGIQIRREITQSAKNAPIKLIENLEAFLQKAIETRQLKLNRPDLLLFNTWKNEPYIPEFYDWQEFRDQPAEQKKKK